MLLISTRNSANIIDPLSAVLKGIADDGGLFVPSSYPRLTMAQLKAMGEKDYPQIAAEVLGMYFDLDFEKLKKMTQEAYTSFDTKQVVPIKKLGEKEYILELFHGPTLAFKDMALQMLPRLMSEAIETNKMGKDVLVLTATSGDTGKAALEGFKNVPHTKIMVFFPNEGVSDMQRLQMVTQEGDNTYVAAVHGNFDDAQTGVKDIFADRDCNADLAKRGYVLSSANSINFGRLAPQIVYYIYGYAKLLRAGAIAEGAPINICVPTGNFGNILSAYYAKCMGLPVHKLICASNKNNVLTDFFDSGIYYAKRAFFRTISPSMDILISSNLERLIFDVLGRDSIQTATLMEELKENGTYNTPNGVKMHMSEEFFADFCDDNRTMDTIRAIYRSSGYVMDPHTAVAQTVYENYLKHTDDYTPTILASTASPYKFAADVVKAITGEQMEDPFAAAERLSSLSHTPVPKQIAALREKEVRHKKVVEKQDMTKEVLSCIEES